MANTPKDTDLNVQFSGNLSFQTLEKLRSFDVVSQLRSNVFTADEVIELVRDSGKEAVEYELEIGRLHSAIIALENRKKELHSRTKKLEWLLAPVRRLPRELLSEVFSHCVETSEFLWDGISVPVRTLTQVCSYWRDVALETPQLWSAISFDLGSELDDTLLLREMSSLLDLSKQTPLTVYIEDIRGEEIEDFDPGIRPAFHRLTQESSRWEFVHLDVPFCELILNFWSLSLELPILHTLELGFQQILDASPVTRLTAFQTAPKLRHLWLGGEVDVSGIIALPWTQLQSLECSKITANSVMKTLSLCRNVTSATLRFIESEDMPPTACPTLPALESLHVVFDHDHSDMDGPRQFFEAVSLPALQSLELERIARIGNSDGGVSQALITSITKHNTLTKLTLNDVVFIHDDYATAISSLLRGLPQIRTLQIIDEQDRILTDAFLRVLCGHKSNQEEKIHSTPLLPSLHCLLFMAKGTKLTEKSVVDLVTSRWTPCDKSKEIRAGGVASLRMVSVTLSEKQVDRAPIRPLLHLAAAGLVLGIMDSSGTVCSIKKSLHRHKSDILNDLKLQADLGIDF